MKGPKEGFEWLYKIYSNQISKVWSLQYIINAKIYYKTLYLYVYFGMPSFVLAQQELCTNLG